MDISNLERLDEDKDIIEEEYYVESDSNYNKPCVDYQYNDVDIITKNSNNKSNNFNNKSNNFNNKENTNDKLLSMVSSSSSSLQNLLYNLHECNVKLESSESQNEQYQQMIKNFNDNEKKLRLENSKLVQLLSKKDQDVLLLEKKLQQIVSIEYPDINRSQQLNKEISIEELRGRLLCSADTKIGELMEALEKTKQILKDQELQLSEKLIKHKSDKDALKKELKKMSDQLAQRAVLYSAQERRWHDNVRYQDSNHLEKDNELVRLRARLQQLEGQFEKADRERIEGILLHRQYQSEKSVLQSQIADYQERISTIDAELSVATSRNLTLQNTIDRLKGSDIEALERDLTHEVETIREEARQRESILKRQVDEARSYLTNETENREKLLDQIQTLRNELDEKNALLRQVNENGYSALQNSFTIRDQEIVANNDSPVTNVNSSLVESDGSIYSNFDVIIETHESQEIDNSKFAAMFDLSLSFSEVSILTDADHRSKSKPHNPSINSVNSHSTRYDDCSTSNDSFYEEETLINPKVNSNDGVEVGFLLGGNNISKNNTMDSDSQQGNKTFNDTVLISQDDEVSNLKNELNTMKHRERHLIKTLKVQGSKLALVLKRASELVPNYNYNNGSSMSLSSNDDKSFNNESATIKNSELENLKNVLKEKDHSISMLTIQEGVLKEQLTCYKEELRLFEEQIKQNKDLGLYQASEIYQTKITECENKITEYETKIKNYDNEISQLQRQLSDALKKLDEASGKLDTVENACKNSSDLRESNIKLLDELDTTKKELDEALNTLSETSLKLKSLESKFELTSTLSSSSLTKVSEQLVLVTEELEAARENVAKTNSELESARVKITEYETKVLSSSSELASLIENNAHLVEENSRLHSFVREFVETEKSLNLEIFGLQSENDKLKEKLTESIRNEDPEYSNNIILQVEEYWMEQARVLKEEIENLTSSLKKLKHDTSKDKEMMLSTYDELNKTVTQHWQREMEKAINELTLKLTNNTYNKLLQQAHEFVTNIESINSTNETNDDDSNMISKDDLLLNVEMSLRAYINTIKEEMIGLGLEIQNNNNNNNNNNNIAIQKIDNAIANGHDTLVKKLRDEIQVLKRSLAEHELKSELKLNMKIEEVKAMYKTKITCIRTKISEKYKKALESLREEKDKEMNIMVELVRKECEDIFTEANKMIQQEREKKFVHTNSGDTKESIMLAPEVTKELIETILGRSADENELRALFNNKHSIEMTPDGNLVLR